MKDEKLEVGTELLRKCIANAEQMVAAFEANYTISNDLKRTINEAKKLLKKFEEPSLDKLLDTLPMQRFADIAKCFEACKSKSDIAKVIKAAPPMFGTFWAEYDDHSFTIVNRFFDDEFGSYCEEEYWYDYPEDWKDN